jgi:hypothetical protein
MLSRIRDYFASRLLSFERINAKKLYMALKLPQEQDSETRCQIALAFRNLSMTDAYWLKTGNKTWEEMDLRRNALNESVTDVALLGKGLNIKGRPQTPEFLVQGTYAKAWVRENNTPYLYKASSEKGMESETEIEVSNILGCTNIPHAMYLPAEYGGKKKGLCKCANVTTDRQSLVTAAEYARYCANSNIKFEEEIMRIDKKNVSAMCVVDYLCSNADRHMGNWGFFMENSSGKIKCCHPLFDHNNAFSKEDMETYDGGESQVFGGFSKQEVAKKVVADAGIIFNRQVTEELFLDELHYETFTKRAEELGLCEHKIKKWMLWKKDTYGFQNNGSFKPEEL